MFFCVHYGYLLRRSTRDDESIIVFALFSPTLRRSSTTLTLCPSLEEAHLPTEEEEVVDWVVGRGVGGGGLATARVVAFLMPFPRK